MGGKSASAPNYAPMAAASRESAKLGYRLGQEQLQFSRQQYQELSPILREIAATQQSAQEEQMRQARDYYDYMQSTYRPIEQGLAAQAQRFNEADYREQLAQQAAAETGRAFSTTQAAQQRVMAAMGVNPNSGRFASMQNQSALGLSAQRAAAMTGARQQAQQLGWARQMDVAGLGRGLSGASTAAYAGATGAGNAAGNMYMAPGNQYMAGMGQGSGLIMQGQGMNMQGLGNILSSQTSVYNTGVNAQGEMMGALLGAGGTLGAAALAPKPSDRRLKQNIVEIGVDEATGLPLYEFEYKILPMSRFRGVMADDVEKRYPDAVSVGKHGFKLVNYSMLGIEMVEV
jgi:hypothetical protein